MSFSVKSKVAKIPSLNHQSNGKRCYIPDLEQEIKKILKIEI